MGWNPFSSTDKALGIVDTIASKGMAIWDSKDFTPQDKAGMMAKLLAATKSQATSISRRHLLWFIMATTGSLLILAVIYGALGWDAELKTLLQIVGAFEVINSMYTNFTNEAKPIINDVAAKMVIAGCTLLMAILRVKPEFRICSHRPIVPSMVLTRMCPTTTNTKIIDISLTDVFIEDLLGLFKLKRFVFILQFPFSFGVILLIFLGFELLALLISVGSGTG